MGEPPDLGDLVRAFVAQQSGIPVSRIHRASRLEEDLGMTGDDSAAFLETFAAEFGVDLAGLDFHKHFGPEGCNPLWIFWRPAWLMDHGHYPVTVDHLIRVAEIGRWISPPRVGTADGDAP